MTSSKTLLPVLGVPVESKTLQGLDSLLSIAQMPAGVPVGTLAIGRAGAVNAALLAAAIVARADERRSRERLAAYRDAADRVPFSADARSRPRDGARRLPRRRAARAHARARGRAARRAAAASSTPLRTRAPVTWAS